MICKHILPLAIISLVHLSTGLFSQNIPDNASWQSAYKNYTVDNGLPSDESYMAIQDHKGQIWITTDQGISRFDGVNFKNYSSTDGLCHDVYFGMIEKKSDSTIWFYGKDGCISIYKDQVFHDFEANDSLKKILEQKIVVSIAQSGNSIWLGIDGRMKQGKYSPMFIRLSDNTIDSIIWVEPNFDVHRACLNTEQTALFSNYAGTWDYPSYFYYINDTNVSKVDISSIPVPISQIRSVIDSFLLMSNGLLIKRENQLKPLAKWGPRSNIAFSKINERYYLGREDGLFSIQSSDKGKINKINSINTTSIVPLEDSTIIYTSGNSGIWFESSAKPMNKHFDQNENHKKFLTKFYLNRINYKSNRLPPSLKYLDRNLFTTQHREVLSIVKGRIYEYEKLLNGVNCVTYLSNGNVAFGTGKGVVICRDRKIIESTGKLYISNEFTNQFQINYKILPKTKEFNQSVISISAIGTAVYFTTTEGTFYSKAYGKTVAKIKCPLSRITHVDTVNDSLLLVTSKTKISFYNTVSQKWTPLDLTGKNIQFIRNISFDQNQIWLSTNNGLHILQFSNDLKVTEHLKLDKNFGLLSNQVLDVVVGDTTYVITNKGVTRFNYRSEFFTRDSAEIYIEEVQSNAKSPSSKPLQLPHTSNHLNVYISSSFLYPFSEIGFEYRVTPILTNWTSLVDNEIKLSNLPIGNYTLEFRQNTRQSKTKRFNFQVNPPWWQKTTSKVLFFILGITAGACLIYFIFRFRLRSKLNRQNLERAKNKALSAQLNPHFIFNSLNSLQSLVYEEKKLNAIEMISKFSTMMRRTLDQTELVLVTLDKELETIRNYAVLEQLRMGEKLNFEIKIESGVDPEKVFLPPMILQPIVENAIWHGINPKDNGGTIKIAVSRTTKNIQIEVIDNGVGWSDPTDSSRSHKGMQITRERLAALKTELGKEATFEIVNRMQKEKISGVRAVISIPEL